jgi:hypothetical protein
VATNTDADSPKTDEYDSIQVVTPKGVMSGKREAAPPRPSAVWRWVLLAVAAALGVGVAVGLLFRS